MRTRNLLHAIACLAILATGLSCRKEMPGEAGNDEMAGQEHKVTFRINLDGRNIAATKATNPTKAVTIDEYDDATINRLDIFEFKMWNSKPIEHYSLTAAEIAAGEFTLQKPTDQTYRYLVVANGGPLAMARLEKQSPASGEYSTPDYHRLPEAYGGADCVPMGAILQVSYSSDHSEEINLYRYMYRVDVGSITANFDNPVWMGKDVFVKRIALINVFQAFPYYYWVGSYSSFTPLNCLFGGKTSYNSNEPFFGGITTDAWRIMGNSIGTDNSVYMYDGNGGSESYTLNLNNNYRAAAGTLRITATGDLLDATVQSYDNSEGEGRLCSSTNPSQSHTLTVNKSFYAIPGTAECGNFGITQTYNNQNAYPKLVIELSVNGNTVFYPIQMYYPQPNTVYSLSSITLKGSGSSYSNFIEEKTPVEYSMAVAPWTDITISNIDVEN